MNVGRNDPCPCGSGKKYKKCCLQKELQEQQERIKKENEFGGKHLERYGEESCQAMKELFDAAQDPALEEWLKNDLEEGARNLKEYEDSLQKE